MGTLDWLSDNLIELRGPVNLATNLPINNTATVTAKLYDTAKDALISDYRTVLTADALLGATSIFVQDRVPFSVGDTASVMQDNGSELAQTILTLPGGTQEITFSGGLAASAAKGSVVRRTALTSSALYISIDDWSEWQALDFISIGLLIGVVERTVTSINRNAGYARLNATIGSAAASGGLVKRKLGADLTLASFGVFPTSNPVVGDPAWGFRGTINHDHADLFPGIRVRGEITVVDGTLNMSRKAIATVIVS